MIPHLLLAKVAAPAAGLIAGVAGFVAYELSGLPGIVVAVLGAIAALAAIAGTIFGVKYRAVADSETRAREAAEALAEIQTDRVAVEQARADDVLRRLDESRQKLEETRVTLVESQKTIARLEALPNLERVLELVGNTFERYGMESKELADRNDLNSERRHKETIEALRDLKGRAA